MRRFIRARAVHFIGCSEQFSIGFTGIVNSLLDGSFAPLTEGALSGSTRRGYATAWFPDGYLPGNGTEPPIPAATASPCLVQISRSGHNWEAISLSEDSGRSEAEPWVTKEL